MVNMVKVDLFYSQRQLQHRPVRLEKVESGFRYIIKQNRSTEGMFKTQKVRRHDKPRKEWSQH